MKKYIVTNFAYGTGPYLRTTELALAFNNELAKQGQERLGIIVPWVYGDKQKRIMLEEFSAYENEIYLNAKLGSILKSVFYGDNSYQDSLIKWSENVKEISAQAKKHLSSVIKTETLGGQETFISSQDIVLELNRSPRLRYDIAPAYFTTFGYIAEILEQVREISEHKIAVNRDILAKGIDAANWVESAQHMRAVAYPATFTWQGDYQLRYDEEILTPPISRLYKTNTEQFEPGIFVTLTGIPGLERLYADAKRLGIKLYSNDTEAVPGSEKKLPHAIPNPNTILQFARAGWGSVWLSMISGTPLVVPDFDPQDDPEIYFNNQAIEKLGIGHIYRGESLEQILELIPEIKANSKKLCGKIKAQWGTLDGNEYCAKIFVRDFVRK